MHTHVKGERERERMVRKCRKRKQCSGRRWEDLDKDVLILIFSLMKDKELVETVSWVCSSWRLVCWDILLWKSENTLDFTALKRSCRRDFCESYHSVATRLMSVLKSIAFEENRLTSVTSMVFHWALPLSDKHLVYLAERYPLFLFLFLFKIFSWCLEHFLISVISFTLEIC